jgi:hypothetical protein
MVAWWKRLLFSLASMVAAAVLLLACVFLEGVLKGHPASIHSSELLLTIVVMVGFCLIGWVFSIPVVLIIRNIRGWRFWFYWIFGSCVGPLLMLLLCLGVFVLVPHSPDAHWFYPALWPLIYFAAAISSLTSLFYLLLFRWAQRREDQKSVAPTL